MDFQKIPLKSLDKMDLFPKNTLKNTRQNGPFSKRNLKKY